MHKLWGSEIKTHTMQNVQLIEFSSKYQMVGGSTVLILNQPRIFLPMLFINYQNSWLGPVMDEVDER